MFGSRLKSVTFCVVAGGLGFLLAAPTVRAASVEGAIDKRGQATDAAAAAQAKIDALSDDADKLAAEYRALLKETKALDVYNEQVEKLLASQDAEIESLRSQIDSVTHIGRQVLPLMARMIDSLEQFVDLDVPFLLEERTKRVDGIRALMDRADVTISEKFRRLLEAYQIENEFGRTIEAYRADLQADGKTRTVDFLRVGRVALLYQTLDGNETGAWDTTNKGWTILPEEYRGSVRQGLRIARKQVAPDLLYIPVPAAEAAK